MRIPVAVVALVTAAALSGCTVHHNPPPPPPPAPGNINLLWSFADGNTCSTLGGFVDHIQVTIPNEILANNGVFPCSVSGVQGIQLQDFSAGSYSVTVAAVASNGFVLYQGGASFSVNGDITVNVPMQPVNNAQPGDVTFTWSFADGKTCAQLPWGAHIVINIPGEQLANGGNFPCSAQGTQGIVLQNFQPGSYTFTIDAVDAQNRSIYRNTGGFTVNGNVPVNVTLNAENPDPTGTIQLRWSFLDASHSPHTCAQAGVGTVRVSFGGFTMDVPCSANGIDGADFTNVTSGSYDLVLTGLTGTGQSALDAYSYAQTITFSGGTQSFSTQMTPNYGQWDLTYNFSNAASCAVAGVSKVSLVVLNAQNQDISGTNGQLYTCGDAPNNLFHYDNFPGGGITIQMFGFSSGGQKIRGATRSTTIVGGAANSTTVTLDTCGTQGSGC